MKNRQIENQKILPLPFDALLKEGASQSKRIVLEVMDALFAKLPEGDTSRQHDFILAAGTKCWIKKFHPPKKNEGGEWVYGFDVKFEEGFPLAHIEFSVSCSGWERVLTAPTSE